jgi:starvation-inducible DNA-binding protein
MLEKTPEMAAKKLTPSKLKMDDKKRAKMVALLQARLSDAIDLMLIAKQAHWNVKGPHFMSLHKTFDELHAAVEGQVDELAERLVALGGIARGTVRMVAEDSTLAPYPGGIVEGAAHIDAVATALADFGGKLRAAIDEADDADDDVTQDLFTGMTAEID